jgi:hypothetical protein
LNIRVPLALSASAGSTCSVAGTIVDLSDVPLPNSDTQSTNTVNMTIADRLYSITLTFGNLALIDVAESSCNEASTTRISLDPWFVESSSSGGQATVAPSDVPTRANYTRARPVSTSSVTNLAIGLGVGLGLGMAILIFLGFVIYSGAQYRKQTRTRFTDDKGVSMASALQRQESEPIIIQTSV